MHRVIGVLMAGAVTWHGTRAWGEEGVSSAAAASEAPAASGEAPEVSEAPAASGEAPEVSEAPAASGEAPEVSEEAPPVGPMRDRNAGARLGLVVGGSVALAAFYGLPCAGAGGLWCVPFAGPVLVVAKRERADGAPGDEGGDGIVPPAFVYALAGSLGMLQVASVVVITAGALMPRREVPDTSRSITVLPMVSSSTAGVGVAGTW